MLGERIYIHRRTTLRNKSIPEISQPEDECRCRGRAARYRGGKDCRCWICRTSEIYRLKCTRNCSGMAHYSSLKHSYSPPHPVLLTHKCRWSGPPYKHPSRARSREHGVKHCFICTVGRCSCHRHYKAIHRICPGSRPASYRQRESRGAGISGNCGYSRWYTRILHRYSCDQRSP